jgi:hypothetical protein
MPQTPAPVDLACRADGQPLAAAHGSTAPFGECRLRGEGCGSLVARRGLAVGLALATAAALCVAPAWSDDGDAPGNAPAKAPAKAPATQPTPAPAATPASDPANSTPNKSSGAAQRRTQGGGSSEGNPAGVIRSSSRASDWQVDFRPGALRLFVDGTTGEKYWYFTYKVVNRTGVDRLWAPRFEFFSDRGEIKVSGKQVPTKVTDSLLEMLGNPLLQDQNRILGDLLIGEENAKEGLVVWPAGDADITELTIFVTGASGKVRKVPDAKTRELKAERWTLRFNYLVPGDAVARGSEAVEPAEAADDVREGAERRPDDIGVWLWR